MKKVLAIFSVLLLTACTVSTSHVMGEVVSCESISQDNSFIGGIELDCLDGTGGHSLVACEDQWL